MPHHKAELSMLLLKKTINWVRVINPTQPITMAPWKEDWSSDDSTDGAGQLYVYPFRHHQLSLL